MINVRHDVDNTRRHKQATLFFSLSNQCSQFAALQWLEMFLLWQKLYWQRVPETSTLSVQRSDPPSPPAIRHFYCIRRTRCPDRPSRIGKVSRKPSPAYPPASPPERPTPRPASAATALSVHNRIKHYRGTAQWGEEMSVITIKSSKLKIHRRTSCFDTLILYHQDTIYVT
jgi:hypothetical protein